MTLAGLNKKLLIPLPLKAIQNLTFQYETPCIFPLLYIGIRKVSNMKTIFILIQISVAYDPRKSFLLGVTIRERQTKKVEKDFLIYVVDLHNALHRLLAQDAEMFSMGQSLGVLGAQRKVFQKLFSYLILRSNKKSTKYNVIYFVSQGLLFFLETLSVTNFQVLQIL